MRTVVSADLGGTNSRFLLSELMGKQDCSFESRVILAQSYRNEDYGSFTEVFTQFLLKDAKAHFTNLPLAACFAVAGPVHNNKVIFTNRVSWCIDGGLISQEFKIPRVQLINDFVAAGYGLLTLKEDTECICLQSNIKNFTAPIVCIGPGTGFGECFLTPDDGKYQCFPSQGGHAVFAPRNDLEVELLAFLEKKFKQEHRVSVERVISGPGLANIYEFLSIKFPEQIDSAVNNKISEAGEMKAATIATTLSDPLCKRTMEIFASTFGAEAGVAALKWMPFGGLYLIGGLTSKNIDLIRDPDGPFLRAFLDQARMSDVLKSIPLYAVLVEDLGERGAEYYATGLTHLKPMEAIALVPNLKSTTSCVSVSFSFYFLSLLAATFAGAAMGFAISKFSAEKSISIQLLPAST